MKSPLLLGLLGLSLTLAGCQRPGADNELVVGMDLSYPPFEYIGPDGSFQGVSVDLAHALGDALDRPVRIENIPFVGLIPALKSDRIDLILSSMTATEERRKSIAFSSAYLTTGLALLVPVGSDVESIHDLDRAGRVVAVRQGTTGEVFADANLTNAQILRLEKESSAVLEVLQGKADAFIYDQMSVWRNWQQHPEQTRALLTPLRTEKWAIGLRQNDDRLRQDVNAFLNAYRTGRGFERLGEKHLSREKESFQELGVPFVF